MEVLCIESSTCPAWPEAICVHQGSYYHVTSTVESEFVRGSNIWYSLLETGIFIHHSSLFVKVEPRTEEVIERLELVPEKV